MSVDGKIALPSREGVRISNDEDLKRLHELRAECDAILVEGGSTVNWSFLRAGLADELLVFVGSFIIGGPSTPTLVGGEGAHSLERAIRLRLKQATPLGDGVLIEYAVVR